jgi:hypothetical protein
MIRLLTCAALIAALTATAAAGSRSYYNANGSYAGSSITRGNYSTFTDGGGRYVGSSVTRGRTTVIYGANGSRAGSSVRTGR